MPAYGDGDAEPEDDSVGSMQTVEEDENSSSDEGDRVYSVLV